MKVVRHPPRLAAMLYRMGELAVLHNDLHKAIEGTQRDLKNVQEEQGKLSLAIDQERARLQKRARKGP